MKKFSNLNNHGLNNQIITRRSNMKKVLAAVVASGFAFAVVAGAVAWTESGNADVAFAVESSEVYLGTSPDLPESGEKVEIIREYVGTSPDLPVAGETMLDLDGNTSDVSEAGNKFEMVGTLFADTSPDLPEAGEKIEAAREYVGTSPDLPVAGEPMNISRGEFKMVGSSFPNTSPDLN